MKRSTQLSVIIPAYNEGNRIAPTLERAINYLERQPYYYEIIVVDDGSTDHTARVVRRFTRANYNVKLTGYKENKGKGYAVQFGMKQAAGDYHLFIDSDGAITIDHLDIFWPHVRGGHEVIIGSIELPGHTAVDNNEWYRRILGKMSKYLIRATAVPGIHDTQRAFKLFSKKASARIFDRQTIERWGFDIELLAIAQELKYDIKEIPVIWINADDSRQEGIKTYIKTLLELAEIVRKRMLGHYKPRVEQTHTLQEIQQQIINN